MVKNTRRGSCFKGHRPTEGAVGHSQLEQIPLSPHCRPGGGARPLVPTFGRRDHNAVPRAPRREMGGQVISLPTLGQRKESFQSEVTN